MRLVREKSRNKTDTMTKDEKTKKGILKYVASTGAKGVKFEDEPDTWYNPATDQAREQVSPDYIGKEVEVLIIPGKRTSFSSMVLIKETKKHPHGAEVVKAETLTDKGLSDAEKAIVEHSKLEISAEDVSNAQKEALKGEKEYADIQALAIEKGYPVGPAPGTEIGCESAKKIHALAKEEEEKVKGTDLENDVLTTVEGTKSKEGIVNINSIKQEKVLPQTPSPKEESMPDEAEEDVLIEAKIEDFGNRQFVLKMVEKEVEEHYTQNTYERMRSAKLETAKKGPMKLTYTSWAEAWDTLKNLHPTATYHVSENKVTGMPYVSDKTGAFVKVSVTVLGITHTVHLPVMDHSNKAIKEDALDTFAINKSIMRAFAKAIAMHGMGIYVFKGEDYPEETKK